MDDSKNWPVRMFCLLIINHRWFPFWLFWTNLLCMCKKSFALLTFHSKEDSSTVHYLVHPTFPRLAVDLKNCDKKGQKSEFYETEGILQKDSQLKAVCEFIHSEWWDWSTMESKFQATFDNINELLSKRPIHVPLIFTKVLSIPPAIIIQASERELLELFNRIFEIKIREWNRFWLLSSETPETFSKI